MRRFLFISVIFVIGTSCSTNVFLNLNNKEFTNNSLYKVERLNFINDTICVYTQEFSCDIDSVYKKIRAVCLYSVKDNYITIKNTKNSLDSSSIECFPLPFSVIQQCKYMHDDLMDILSRPTGIGVPPPISLAEMYGFINILQTDTLYFDKDVIYYIKSFKRPINNLSLLIQTSFFIENGKECNMKKMNKRAKRLGKKIPFNRAECHGAVPFWE